MKKILLPILAMSLFFTVPAGAATNLPAFPGAEGFGSTTPGGRGGQVIHVTNLNASGPGSLREALESIGPRMVVFDVAGTIDFGSRRMKIINPYVTVSGQTAPGDGILIKGELVLQDTHDVVLRYLRVRVEDLGCPDPVNNCPSENGDGLHFTGEVNNVIIDHSSISWATDENIDFYNAAGNRKNIRNVTLQWNVIGEGDADSSHPESNPATGAHSMGLLLAPRSFTELIENISIHHNLFIHNNARNPYLQRGAPPGSSDSTGVVRFINNVVYNWNGAPSEISPYFGGEIRVDFLGNYYRSGPNTSNSQKHPIWCYASGVDAYGRCVFYLSDNLFQDGVNQPETNIGAYLTSKNGANVVIDQKAGPLLNDGVAVDTSQSAPGQIIDSGGTYLPANTLLGRTAPVRDTVDTRLITELQAGTGCIGIGCDGVRRFPVLATKPAPLDSDVDGMPDSWEQAKGLSPILDDSAEDRDGDGYTNVEEYINSLTSSSTPTPTSTPADIKAILAAYATSQADFDMNNDGKVNTFDFAISVR